MSYLLTEISMEMMGYKFYNLDGVCSAINFQKASNAVRPLNEEETESLEELIGFGKTDEAMDNMKSANEKNETDLTAINTVHQIDLSGMDTTEATTSSNQTETGQLPQESSKSDTPIPVVATAPSSYKYSTQSEALLKLLETEYNRVRGQVMRQNTQYLQENAETVKRIDQGKGFNANEFLKTHHAAESKNLQKEVENMKVFRKLVEFNLVKMNSKSYEKYVRTFMRIQPELNKYSLHENK